MAINFVKLNSKNNIVDSAIATLETNVANNTSAISTLQSLYDNIKSKVEIDLLELVLEAGDTYTDYFDVVGLMQGDVVDISFESSIEGLVITKNVDTDLLLITVHNPTANQITISAGKMYVASFDGEISYSLFNEAYLSFTALVNTESEVIVPAPVGTTIEDSYRYKFQLSIAGDSYVVDWGDGNIETVVPNIDGDTICDHTYTPNSGDKTLKIYGTSGIGIYSFKPLYHSLNPGVCVQGFKTIDMICSAGAPKFYNTDVVLPLLTEVYAKGANESLLNSPITEMFSQCKSLTTFNLYDKNLTQYDNVIPPSYNFNKLFYNCYSIENVELFIRDGDSICSTMFKNCKSLDTIKINISDGLISNALEMFYGTQLTMTILDTSNNPVAQQTFLDNYCAVGANKTDCFANQI
jgi:hypothetical protein